MNRLRFAERSTWTRTLLLLILSTASWGCADSPSTEREATKSPDETSAAASSRSAVDVSGIELFWQVVDSLSEDREPSPELWRTLFETPGYSALTRSEFESSFFQENFRLVFMPSLRDSLARVLDEGTNIRYLRHYTQVDERRAELVAFAEGLGRSDLMEEPSRLAAEWLPPPPPDELAPVALVVFGMDARGYDPIVIDLLAARELDLHSFLAHESHHWYRNQRSTIEWDDVAPHDEDLLWTLYQIQGEGIADQIDKRPWIDGGEPVPAPFESYSAAYLEALADSRDDSWTRLTARRARSRNRAGSSGPNRVPIRRARADERTPDRLLHGQDDSRTPGPGATGAGRDESGGFLPGVRRGRARVGRPGPFPRGVARPGGLGTGLHSLTARRPQERTRTRPRCPTRNSGGGARTSRPWIPPRPPRRRASPSPVGRLPRQTRRAGSSQG